MKLGDLQSVVGLQAALGRLDCIPPGCALLEANGLDIELTADELAAFIAWRRADLHRQLHALGVEPEDDGGPKAPPAARSRRPAKPRSPRLVAKQPAAAATPRRAPVVDYEAEAVKLVIPGRVEDLRQGLITQEEFDEFKGRRRDQIDAAIAEMKRGVTEERCHCGKPATMTIAGKPWCEEHGKAARAAVSVPDHLRREA